MYLNKRIRTFICEYCDISDKCNKLFSPDKSKKLPRPLSEYIPTLFIYCEYYENQKYISPNSLFFHYNS